MMMMMMPMMMMMMMMMMMPMMMMMMMMMMMKIPSCSADLAPLSSSPLLHLTAALSLPLPMSRVIWTASTAQPPRRCPNSNEEERHKTLVSSDRSRATEIPRVLSRFNEFQNL